MGHESEVWAVDISEKYVVSGSGDCSVMVGCSLTQTIPERAKFDTPLSKC